MRSFFYALPNCDKYDTLNLLQVCDALLGLINFDALPGLNDFDALPVRSYCDALPRVIYFNSLPGLNNFCALHKHLISPLPSLLLVQLPTLEKRCLSPVLAKLTAPTAGTPSSALPKHATSFSKILQGCQALLKVTQVLQAGRR